MPSPTLAKKATDQVHSRRGLGRIPENSRARTLGSKGGCASGSGEVSPSHLSGSSPPTVAALTDTKQGIAIAEAGTGFGAFWKGQPLTPLALFGHFLSQNDSSFQDSQIVQKNETADTQVPLISEDTRF